MAKDREGSVNIYGAMQAKTAQGIVAYTDGIAHEKEDGTVINLDEMLKNGVGGGSAIVDVEELVYSGWGGTPVPNSGEVGDIYFNTNLSNSEYYEIVNKLNFIDASTIGASGFSFYPVYATLIGGSIPYVLAFKKFSDTDIDLAMVNFSTMQATIDFFIGDEGWQQFANPQLGSVYDPPLQFLSELSGLPIGSENDKLSSLISTTPFVKGKEPKDDVFYRLNIPGAEVVPDSGYIEKVYVNPSLSDSETEVILSSLEYNTVEGQNVCAIAGISDFSEFLAVLKIDDSNYAIVLQDSESSKYLYLSGFGWGVASSEQGFGSNWNWEVQLNYENALSSISSSVGLTIQNDKLSKIFSLTPYFGESKSELYTYKNGEYKKVLQEGDTTNGIIYIDIESTSENSFSITEEKYNILKNNDNVAIRLKIVGTYNTDIYLLYKSNINNENKITLIGISEDKKIVCVQVLSNLACVFTSVLPQYINSLTINNNSLIISSNSLGGVSTYSVNIDTAPTSSSKNLISSGAVYTALESYAKTEEVNQMIADYITTNFENGDEGSY